MKIFDMVRFIYLLLTAQSAIHYRIFQHPAAMKWWQNHWELFYEEQAAEKEAKFDEENSRTWYKSQANLPTPERSLALYQEVGFSDFSKYEFAEQAAAPSFVKQEGDPFSTILALLCLGTSGFFDLGSASPFSSMLLLAALCFSSNEVSAQSISSSRKYSSFSMSASLPTTLTFLLAVGAGVRGESPNSQPTHYPTALQYIGNSFSLSTFSSSHGVSIVGGLNNSNYYLGWSIAGLHTDQATGPNDKLLIGAFYADAVTGGGYNGNAFLLNDQTNSNNIIIANLTATKKTTFTSAHYDYLGRVVANLGDLNGDGLPEMGFGVYGYPGSYQKGRVYIIWGSTTADTYLSNIVLNQGFSITGINNNDYLGSALAKVGNFSGAAHGAFVVGARGYPGAGGLGKGMACVIYPSSFVNIEISTLTTSQGVCFVGENSGDVAGGSVAGVSDLNGDGRQEVLIGYRCGAYLVFGQIYQTTMLSLSALSLAQGINLSGTCYSAGSFYTVTDAGYFFGQSTPTFMISNSLYSSSRGAVWLINGLSALSGLNLASFSSTNGVMITGTNANDGVGYTTALLGDINRDGVSDIAIGAPNYPAGSELGLVCVVYGGKVTANLQLPGGLSTTQGFCVYGIGGFGYSITGNFNYRGAPAWAASTKQYLSKKDRGAVYIFYGGVNYPTASPSSSPTQTPTCFPTPCPTLIPTNVPTILPTNQPTLLPSVMPSNWPSDYPSFNPSKAPTVWPTCLPTDDPTRVPTLMPTMVPSYQPTSSPTAMPTRVPTLIPTSIPTNFPTLDPTQLPTSWPSSIPTNHPSFTPTLSPTIMPSGKPSLIPTLMPSVMPSGLPTYPPTYWPSNFPSPGPSYSPTWLPSFSPSGRPTWMPTQTRRANASITFSFSDGGAINFKRVVYDEKSDTIFVSTDSRLLLIDQAKGGIMTGSALISLADGSEAAIIDMFISDQSLYVMSKVKSRVNSLYFATAVVRYNITDGTVGAFWVNAYSSHGAVILASNMLLSPANLGAGGVCFFRFGIDTLTGMNNPCYFTPERTYTFAHAIECQLPFLCFGGNTDTGIMVIFKLDVSSLDSSTVGAKAYEVQRQDPQSGDTHQLVRLASGAYGDKVITLSQLYRSTEGVSYLCASFQGLTINWAQQMAVSATDVLSVMLPNGNGVVLLCAGYDHFSGAPGRQLVLIKLDENTGEALSAIKIITLLPVQGDCRFGEIGTRGILITASLLQHDGTQSGLIFFLDFETMTASSLPTDVRFMPFNTTAVLNAKPASLQINVNSLSLGYWTGPRVTRWSMVTTPLAIQQFSKIFSLAAPSLFPTYLPSQLPTRAPSRTPTRLPTKSPAWIQPTRKPMTSAPVLAKNETHMPTLRGAPTSEPSGELSSSSPSTKSPSMRKPSFRPSSSSLTRRPSPVPYVLSGQPSQLPVALSELPTLSPTELLTLLPTLLNTTMKNVRHTEASDKGSGFRAGMIALGAVIMLLICLLVYWKYRNKKKGSVSPGEKELIDWIQSSIYNIEEGDDGHQVMMDHFLKNLPEAMRHVFSQSEISSFILFIRTIENYVFAFSLNDAKKVAPIDAKELLLFNKETEKRSIDGIYTKGSLASRVLYQCVDNRYQLLQEKLKKEHEKIADDILDEILTNGIATSDRVSRKQSVSSEGDDIESLYHKWMGGVYDEQDDEEGQSEGTVIGLPGDLQSEECEEAQEEAPGHDFIGGLSGNKSALHYHEERKGGLAVRRASPV